MMKQTLTILLLLAALLVPGNTSAQTYSVVSEGLTLQFTVSGTEATITGTPNKVPNPRQSSCYDLTNGGVVNIPATVTVGSNTYTVTKIGDAAFGSCGISSLTLPSTLKEIGQDAFSANTSDIAFDDLVIPASVQKIGQSAFNNHRIKHLSFEVGSQLSFLGAKAFGTYRPASESWSSTFTPSSQYNIEYYDLSNTQLKAASFQPNGLLPGQQFYMYLRLQGRILIYLPATFDVYPCGNLNNGMSGGIIDQTADETNIVRANGYCDNLLVSDDMSFRAPHAFTAKKVTCNRTFSNTSGKAVSTLYLPYPTDLPTGMQAYEFIFKGLDEDGNKAFCFAPVPLGTRLEAYKPYLVRITDGASHTLPTMQNVQVPATPDVSTTAQISADGDWAFNGTTEFIGNTEAYAKKAYYLNGNKWWAVQNGVANDYIAPYRCFISSPTGATPAKSFFMVLDDDNSATDVRHLENDTEADIKSGRYPFYSIDGKLMGNDYDALECGQMYIVNGKKFYKF